MKIKLILGLAILGLAGTLALSSRAQDSGTFTLASNNVPIIYTNSAPSSTVFTINYPVYQGYWVYVSGNSGSTTNSGAALEQLNALFAVSADGSNYTTNRSGSGSISNSSVTNSLLCSLLANGVSTVTARTYVDMRGAKTLKLTGFENGAGGQATNYWTNLVVTVLAR